MVGRVCAAARVCSGPAETRGKTWWVTHKGKQTQGRVGEQLTGTTTTTGDSSGGWWRDGKNSKHGERVNKST